MPLSNCNKKREEYMRVWNPRAHCVSRTLPSNASHPQGWPLHRVWRILGFPQLPCVEKGGFLTSQFWVTMKSYISVRIQVMPPGLVHRPYFLLNLPPPPPHGKAKNQEIPDDWEKNMSCPSGSPGKLSCHSTVYGGEGPGSHGSLHVTHNIIRANQQQGNKALRIPLNDVIYAET